MNAVLKKQINDEKVMSCKTLIERRLLAQGLKLDPKIKLKPISTISRRKTTPLGLIF